jgi:hypothetical protein
MTQPRFTLKELLIGLTAIAVGIAGTLVVGNSNSVSIPNVVAWLGSGLLIGAGALFPFGRQVAGAVGGLILYAVWLALALAMRTIVF